LNLENESFNSSVKKEGEGGSKVGLREDEGGTKRLKVSQAFGNGGIDPSQKQRRVSNRTDERAPTSSVRGNIVDAEGGVKPVFDGGQGFVGEGRKCSEKEKKGGRGTNPGAFSHGSWTQNPPVAALPMISKHGLGGD